MTPDGLGGDSLPADLIQADAADLETLSHVIAEAFHDLAPSRWLIPDAAARRDIFPGYFGLYIEHAMASGVVHTTTDRAAVALWIQVRAGPAAEPADYGVRLAAITGPWVDRFLAFDAALDRHHPTGILHHHLALLAVRPDRQGQGIGTALLRTYHELLDHDVGAPAYLEASDLRTRQLYVRHGYDLRPNAPIRLPDGGPEMWPMWREPRPKRDAP